ncbi:hypothetical protein Dda_3777 [Drechslerella dactyloides]|uniref:PDZ GRASP-type domain-containing protein n=1 Tax=Drechslerella dactyloides TaxID=74499 RepID=A0AAD6NK35_DREDA|nr:hypothetical protein Dda_3777 [Drechslerella dactyloides]
MGNEQSQISGAQTRFGFRVLKRTKDETPLEPWFDFICGINGREIDDGDGRLFQEEVKNCAGKSVTLGVWSAKGQTLRTVVVPLPADDPTPLGVSLKWTGLAASEDVWHVLNISAGSPAEMAGLFPYNDYIIGTPLGVGDLLEQNHGMLIPFVQQHIDRPLPLYVYNHEFNVTREVTILPRKNWGGDGALGCVLGYGALHRLPAPLDEPLSEPGQAMFEYPAEEGGIGEPGPAVATAQDTSSFITPAFALNQAGSPPNVLSPTTAPPATAGTTSPPPQLASARSPPPLSDTPPVMMDPAAIAAMQAGRQTPSTPPQLLPSGSPYSGEQGPGGVTGPPPARSARGKAKGGARGNRVNLMDAYMMEEENKSKKEDYVIDESAPAKSPAPPPGGGRPPPPKKGES